MTSYRRRLLAAIGRHLPPRSTGARRRRREAELWADDEEIQAHWRLGAERALFAEHAVALGAVYDDDADTWTPPAGMTPDELWAAVLDRRDAAARERRDRGR